MYVETKLLQKILCHIFLHFCPTYGVGPMCGYLTNLMLCMKWHFKYALWVLWHAIFINCYHIHWEIEGRSTKYASAVNPQASEIIQKGHLPVICEYQMKMKCHTSLPSMDQSPITTFTMHSHTRNQTLRILS